MRLTPTVHEDGSVELSGRRLRPGDPVDDLTLRAVLEGETAVLEGDEGRLVFATAEGVEVELVPWLQDANVESFESQASGQASFFAGLLEASDDPLAEEALAEGEPEYECIARMLPRVVGVTFVGDERRDERFIIEPDGSVEGLLGPLAELSPEELARRGRWGLIDRRLPLPMLRIAGGDEALEQIAVGTIDANGEPQLLVRRREGERVEHFAPGGDDVGGERFYAAVLEAWRRACEFRWRCAEIHAEDETLVDLAFTSLRLADLTLRGCHPRYGIGTYDRFKDHGFPPTVLHLGRCLLEWGQTARARDVIDCYLSAYVADDGTFVYYGPAVAEYGQFLSLAADYARLSGDVRWWRRRESVLRRVWGRLLDLRAGSLEDDEAPECTRGLIPGLPEADYHGSREQWREYYYAGDAWAVRGLGDVAQMLAMTGRVDEAEAVRSRVAAYCEDLLASVHESSVETEDGLYVPPGPTQREPIARMTQDRHSSYCNYRYFAELVSAGVLDVATTRRVIGWRRNHGGELLAMTRFIDHLDDWPVLNWARGMLETGDVARYQLLLYAHLAHHQAAGWLAAPEQVHIRPDEAGWRSYHAGQVVPSQVVAPQMLRWALLYELRDENVLLALPAAAWRWIEGEGLHARGLPTRWGPVGVSAQVQEEGVRVRVDLPDSGPVRVRLRIPAPPGARVKPAWVEGDDEHTWDEDAGVLTITARDAVRVVAEM